MPIIKLVSGCWVVFCCVFISTIYDTAFFIAHTYTSSTIKLCLHFPKTHTLTYRAFSYSAPRLWNNLPAMNRSITNLVLSRKVLKLSSLPEVAGHFFVPESFISLIYFFPSHAFCILFWSKGAI